MQEIVYGTVEGLKINQGPLQEKKRDPTMQGPVLYDPLCNPKSLWVSRKVHGGSC